jgi:hypothetical protein
VLWVLVLLTPVALLSLRVIDDSALALLIQPLLVVMVLVLLVALGMALRRSLPRSSTRAVLGGVGALLAAGLLALPMIHVIGQRLCPERMGADRGVEVSLQMMEAWRKGEPAAGEVWADGGIASTWGPRAEGITLLDYKLVDSGCWERLAPVITDKTWHEFRVTVREGENDPFSRTIVVHTSATYGGWKIAGVEAGEADL